MPDHFYTENIRTGSRLLFSLAALFLLAPAAHAYGTVDFSNLSSRVAINANPVASVTSASWNDLAVAIFGPNNNILASFNADRGPASLFASGYFISCDNTIPGECQIGDYHFVTYQPSLVSGSDRFCTNDVSYNTGHDYQDCLADSAYAGQDYVVTVTSATGSSDLYNNRYFPRQNVQYSCRSADNHTQLYDLTAGFDGSVVAGGNLGAYSCATNSVSLDGVDGHHYSLVELPAEVDCSALDYTSCKTTNFIQQYNFDVVGSPTVVVQVPTVSILSPKKGDAFSRSGIINYTTQNAVSVTLSYSDKLAAWNNSFVVPTDKTVIASDVPKSGSYTWQTAGLTEGGLYRIIVDVAGMNGFGDQIVSELFSIDFTPPSFIVKADPPVTRGAPVTISVDATEALRAPPTVSVTQRLGVSTEVVMKGQGRHYEGTYSITKGYDGVATISTSGSDIAGNVGTTTLSGGSFAVGINPPPAPRVFSPQTNLVVGTSTISLRGAVRSDTQAVLLVNGIDTYVASSSPDGTFAIADIHLSPDINHGLNVLSVTARDQAGLMSAAVPIQIKYNIAPSVSVLLPAPETIISSTNDLTVRATDENADPLLFTYQITPAQSFDATVVATSTKNEWTMIADAVPSSRFSWDSSEAEDGQYFLRVIADDGLTKVYSTPTPFSIHNSLPSFKFEDGRKTITSASSVTIAGRAITPGAISPRPIVKSVEYSLDNGKTWKLTSLVAGNDTEEARFRVTINNLAEGVQRVLWRVKDSRNTYGRTSHPIIVDRTSPATPIIDSPANNSFVTNEDDEDMSRPGIQISVSGTAEAESLVSLSEGSSTPLAAKTSLTGSFVFHGVTLLDRGQHKLFITASDESGNISPVALRTVVYDNPPVVSILSPKSARGLTGKGVVAWDIRDADGDSIQNVTLEWRRGQGAFTPLAIDQSKSSFRFDVARFQEGDEYQLRLSASDGMATGTDLVNFSVDNTPPSLSSFILEKSVLGKRDVLTSHGTARDDLSGIEYIEYAVAQGDPLPDSFSTALLTSGFLRNFATFTLAYPSTLPEGVATIYARAVDAAGNVSPLLSRTITVDTMPPRIGSFDVMAQGVRLAPDETGAISLYKGTRALLEVSLEQDTAVASLVVGSTTIPLKKDVVSGLWQGIVTSGNASTTLYITAEDNVHNVLPLTPFGSFPPLPPGTVMASLSDGSTRPLEGAVIKVLVLNESTGTFIPLSAAPVTTNAEGKYFIVLPPGTYELSVRADGYHSARQKLTLVRSGFVNIPFSLEAYRGAWGYVQSIYDRFFSP